MDLCLSPRNIYRTGECSPPLSTSGTGSVNSLHLANSLERTCMHSYIDLTEETGILSETDKRKVDK